jgi:hypothetical protein
MTYNASIDGKPVYAGGGTSVNIRENVTTSSAVIGNVSAGGRMGTATGNKFSDLDKGTYDWYEINTGSRLGYVREDLVLWTAKSTGSSSSSKTSSSAGSGDYLKTAFDTESGGFPKWAVAGITVCFVLIGVAVYFLVKKRKGKK